MTMKVFWSWQADLDRRLHQYLVRDALLDACDRLAEMIEVDEADRPEVDSDTSGIDGTPDIVTSILGKIETAAAFVADVTPIGRTVPRELLPNTPDENLPSPKYLQNPNVMSELGYADHAITQRNILLVANRTRYPGPEALPFDWRHRRGPILYTLADDASATERNAARQQLAAQFTQYLQPIIERAAAALPPAPPLLSEPSIDGDPAVWWSAVDGVDFNESEIGVERRTAHLNDGPRIYARLAVDGWTPQNRDALMSRMDQRDVKLSVGTGSGSWGKNADGAFAASGIRGIDDTTYSARGMTQWFATSGEFWGVDTATFGRDDDGDGWYFSYQVPFGPLARFLHEAVVALRSVVPIGRIEVELGASGLAASYLPGEFKFQRIPALCDRVDVRESAAEWDATRRNALLLRYWNALMDAYGHAPAPHLDALERAAAVVLSREDADD